VFRKITSPQLARKVEFFFAALAIQFFAMQVIVGFSLTSLAINKEHRIFFAVSFLVMYFIGMLRLVLEKITPYFYIENEWLFISKTVFWKPHKIKLEDISDVVFAREVNQVNGGTKFHKFVFQLTTGEKFEYKPKKQENEFFNEITSFLQNNINTLPSGAFPDFPLATKPESKFKLSNKATSIIIWIFILLLYGFYFYHIFFIRL